jgi:hypothetical protein
MMPINCLQCENSVMETFRLTDITTYGSLESIAGGSRPLFGQIPSSAPTAGHGRMFSLPDVNLRAGRKAGPELF